MLGTAAAGGPACAADRALLVGIERYADARIPETPGAEADAREMAAMLRSRFSFAADSVKLLLGADASGAAIVHAFRSWLIDATRPGDRVFFHYAGHGSQLDDDNGDEVDGRDETLAPYDTEPDTGANEVRDDAFEGLILGLQGRRVVMVFDACHSGTISRGSPGLAKFPRGGGARYLPRPEQFRELQKQAPAAGSAQSYMVRPAADSRGQKRSGSAFLGEREIGAVTGVVVISAAAPDQIVYPLEVGNDVRGALSHLLGDLHQSASPTVDEIRTQLASRVRALQRARKLYGSQEPQVEVISPLRIDDQPLFASWDVVPALAIANPNSTLAVKLATLGGRTRYRLGEAVAYQVTTSAEGYVYLLIFSSDHSAGCLFPNSEDDDNHLGAGTTTIPRPRLAPFEAQEPAGRDLVVALLASKPLWLRCDDVRTWDDLLRRVGIDALTRAVESAASATRGSPEKPLDWQAAVVAVETEAP